MIIMENLWEYSGPHTTKPFNFIIHKARKGNEIAACWTAGLGRYQSLLFSSCLAGICWEGVDWSLSCQISSHNSHSRSDDHFLTSIGSIQVVRGLHATCIFILDFFLSCDTDNLYRFTQIVCFLYLILVHRWFTSQTSVMVWML